MKGPMVPDEPNWQLLKFWLGPFFGVLYRLDGVWLQTFSDILGTFLVRLNFECDTSKYVKL